MCKNISFGVESASASTTATNSNVNDINSNIEIAENKINDWCIMNDCTYDSRVEKDYMWVCIYENSLGIVLDSNVSSLEELDEFLSNCENMLSLRADAIGEMRCYVDEEIKEHAEKYVYDLWEGKMNLDEFYLGEENGKFIYSLPAVDIEEIADDIEEKLEFERQDGEWAMVDYTTEFDIYDMVYEYLEGYIKNAMQKYFSDEVEIVVVDDEFVSLKIAA